MQKSIFSLVTLASLFFVAFGCGDESMLVDEDGVVELSASHDVNKDSHTTYICCHTYTTSIFLEGWYDACMDRGDLDYPDCIEEATVTTVHEDCYESTSPCGYY